MKKLLLLPLLFLLATVPCFAQHTYTAASCSQANVQTAINLTVDGDKVIIPTTGTPCTWSSGITINGKGIDITGTGTPNAGAGTIGAGTPTTTLIDHASAPFFIFTGLSFGQTAKVELLTMSASGASNASTTATVSFSGTCTSSGCANIRVDNINWTAGTWDGPLADGGFVVTDNVFGVVDHTTSSFSNAAGLGGAGPPLVEVNQSAWQGVGGLGDNSFASADTMGTAQALYIENNSLNGDRATDNDVPPSGGSDGGDRAVCRFNTVVNLNGSGLCSGHGTTWNNFRGQRQLEAYYNTMTCGASGAVDCDNGFGLSGGTGMFFSNTYIVQSGFGFNYSVALDVLRFSPDQLGQWGYCDGTHPYDQSPFTSTSQCLDQPGTGAGLLMNSGASPKPTLVSTGNPGWPNPAIDPVYQAGDFPSGGGGLNASVNANTSHIIANSEYYAAVSNSAQTSATSPFNGTTGTGYGTLARRPTTCTPTVGYWATDQGTWNNGGPGGVLYLCKTANTWTASYTPYTYPHPLTTGAGGSVTLSPSSESYGTFNLGASSSPVTFTLTNSSSTTATSISPSDTDSAEFVITNSGAGSCAAAGGSLAASASCTFTVTFSPTSAGAKTPTLSVSYSGGDGASPQTASLSGTGVSATSPAAAMFGIVELDPMQEQNPIPVLMTASARVSVLDQSTQPALFLRATARKVPVHQAGLLHQPYRS